VSVLLVFILTLGWLNLLVTPCVQAQAEAPDCCVDSAPCAERLMPDCAQAMPDFAAAEPPLTPTLPGLGTADTRHAFASRTVPVSFTAARLPPTPPHPLTLYGMLRI
jgi:hypothetical protein